MAGRCLAGRRRARPCRKRARPPTARLQLDESLAAAHVSLGYVKALYDWDWPGAEREFKRALELSPGDADVHFAYSVTYLTPLGRLDEAVRRSSAPWLWIRFRHTKSHRPG